jgi:hypothetical protein
LQESFKKLFIFDHFGMALAKGGRCLAQAYWVAFEAAAGLAQD